MSDQASVSSSMTSWYLHSYSERTNNKILTLHLVETGANQIQNKLDLALYRPANDAEILKNVPINLPSQEESQLLKKICESLEAIHARYEAHSKEMEELVISLQVSNKEYEDGMQDNLNDISTTLLTQTKK